MKPETYLCPVTKLDYSEPIATIQCFQHRKCSVLCYVQDGKAGVLTSHCSLLVEANYGGCLGHAVAHIDD